MAGSGRFLPQTTVNNFELYEMDSIRSAFDVEAARASLRDIEEDEAAGLDAAQVFDHWSVQVTGIQKRRIMDPDMLAWRSATPECRLPTWTSFSSRR